MSGGRKAGGPGSASLDPLGRKISDPLVQLAIRVKILLHYSTQISSDFSQFFEKFFAEKFLKKIKMMLKVKKYIQQIVKSKAI